MRSETLLTFKHKKTSLCKANAYWMARLSKAAYQSVNETDATPDKDDILRALKADDGKFIDVVPFNAGNAQAIFVEHEKYVVMAFRGTDEIRDWVDNVKAFPIKELFGDFHSGFWECANNVWEGIWAAYQESRRTEIRPLFITGHGLGGAMATIAAARLVHQDLPFSNVYSFGQPRAMLREASRIFNAECGSRFFRFHNNNDLVTRLPFRLMGYSHVGISVYIAEDGMIHSDSFFWLSFLDKVKIAKDVFDDVRKGGIIGGIGGMVDVVLESIADHDMEIYLDAIINWEEK